MDRETVIRHLRAWAEGVDPRSGDMLAADHPAQRPDTLRVVFATLTLLEGERNGSGMQSTHRTLGLAARNAGRPWSANDDESLIASFDAGATIGALAVQMERTRGAITARLVKLGKIEAPPGLRLRGEGEVRNGMS
ncbi:MAG TPA: hypothetical protein VNG69_14605 [Casimicrobiaceae bacterium]|nr:hypothetical protein [Casimicrobiaceae bacterium]